MGGRNPLQRITYAWKNNKNVKLTFIAVILVVCAAVVWIGIFYAIGQQNNKQVTNTTVRSIDVDVQPETVEDIVEEVDDQLEQRAIDGVLVPIKDASNQPVAIMIENAAFDNVRPQFGLGSAQVVYELIVEGGITRFLAVYSAKFPEKIGPVRSSRPTYLEFVSEYDALYGHAGGSPEALAAIDGLEIKDFSALGADSRFFYRDTSRVAPHNLFTSEELTLFAVRDKELTDYEYDFTSWKFTEDKSPDTEPEDHYVDIDFGSGDLYKVHYEYNYDDNAYIRYNGGERQVDANTDEDITTKNVIVQIIPQGVPAGDEGRVNFNVTGTGVAYIANNGIVTEGTWEKPDRLSRTLYYDESGDEIELTPGTTWISFLPETGSIDYK